PSGLVNAVLRKVAVRSLDEWVDVLAPPEESDPLERVALRRAHPPWIARAVESALAASAPGDRASELESALAANNEAPGVTLTARPGRATVEELVDAGASPAPYSPH